MLRSTLKFVSQVLVERYPNFLVSGQVNYAPAVLHKTLALLASLDVDDEAHDIAIAITARLVGIHAHSHAPSLRLFLHDAVTLLSGAHKALVSCL